MHQGSDWSNGWCIEPSTETSCSSQPIQQFTIPVEQVKLTLAGVSGGTALQFNAWGRVTSCPTFTLTTSAAGSACTLCLTVSMDGRVQSHTGDCPSDCDQEGEEMATINKLVAGRSRYRCGHCGFRGQSLHWHCPGCKHWGTIKDLSITREADYV